jgi:adenylylsulfate kinase-like enzyme
MAKIIVIHGPMGCGKSTIVSELVKKLPDYVLVDRAYMKDTMLKNVKSKDPKLAKKLSADAMFLIAKGLLKKGFNLILQETRLPTVKKRIGGKHKIKSFYLYCNVEEAKRRDKIRQKRYVRPKVVEEMHLKHAYPDKGDIAIDTEKNSISKTLKIILDSLSKKN